MAGTDFDIVGQLESLRRYARVLTRDTEGVPRGVVYESNSIALFERGRSSFVLVDPSGHPAQLARGAEKLLTSGR